MGSPAIFSGKFTKLLTQLGLMLSNGAVINNDGEKNYIGYATFENGATTGWSLGTTGTLTNGIPTGTPTFGSGASGTLAISAQSTGPLSGSYSLQLADSAATTAGNMVATSALAIDLEGQARVLTWEFYYKCSANASNGNFSGTSANTFGVAAYDVTNSVWLPTCGNFNIIQNSGVGYSTGTLQTAATTASIRFVIYCANASSGAITMLFDDFYFGPITAPTGAAITDPVAYTPTFTGLGTVTGVNFVSWRVGAYLFVEGTFTSGTPTATEARISLGFNGGNSNVTSASTLPTVALVGSAKVAQNETATDFADRQVLAEASKSYLTFTASYSTYGSSLTKGLGTTVIGPTTTMSFYARVPIQGWSSNVVMSNDTDTRVISSTVLKSGTQAVTASTSTKITGFTVSSDACGIWDGTNNWFKVTTPGYYRVTGMVRVGTGTVSCTARVNGTTSYEISSFVPILVSGSQVIPVRLNAGDTVELMTFCSANDTISATSTQFQIERLSGPATIAATESVNARYTFVGSTAVPNNSATNLSNTYATYTKVKDSHNAFNTTTGVYTFPVSGTYRVSLRMLYVNTGAGAGAAYSTLTQGGSASTVSSTAVAFPVAASIGANPVVSDDFVVNAGDTITLKSTQTSGGALAIFNVADYNSFSIERVGN